MATDKFAISDEDIHAFIDGALPKSRTAEIAALCAASLPLARRIAAFRANRDALAATYGPLIDRPVPLRLQPRTILAASEPVRRARSFAPRWVTAATAAGVALCVGLALMIWRDEDPLVTAAMAARSGTVATQASIAVGETAAADRLAADSLAVPIKIPDLAKAGYRLTALTVYPANGPRHDLQISYRDVANQAFTVFLHPAAGKDRFELHQQDGLEICLWQNDDMGVVMIGAMSGKAMLRLASLTYADLNL
jgi:anti-sigma factor RsiW